MAEVTAVIEEKDAGRTERSWFGHAARLTVEGRTPRS
mgnify:CR=1 FL=1